MRRASWVIAAATLALGAALAMIYFQRIWPMTGAWTVHFRGEELELLSPRMLGLALLGPYFLWMTTRSLADLPWAQRLASVLLRVGFVVLLAIGLARVARTSTSSKLCTVYILDVSDSVPDAALVDARKLVQEAIDKKPADAIVRVVTFAARPRMLPILDDAKQAPPIERHTVSSIGGPPSATAGAATDIASAMRLAYGLYPAGYLKRAVIASDGVQTDGDLLSEAERAREFGVKLFVSPYTQAVPGEVAIRDLRVPNDAKVGAPFELHANIFSSREQKVRLTLRQGEAINGLDGIKQVTLAPGENDVTFKSVVRVAGDVTYALDLSEAEHDRFKENNRMSAAVVIPGPPVVLYIEGNPARANYLQSALTAQQFDVDVRGPRELPTSIRELERYDFVIVSDTPAESVSMAQQEAVESYLRDLGGGFLFAGGPSGYSLGGWQNTTFERILPVRMDADKRREEPAVAMSLVIDRSGSMTGLPLEMAKQAAKATADTLSPDDLLEVIAFDGVPTRIVRFTAARHRARIQNDISRIAAGNDTQIFPALDAAYQSLSVVRAKRKHAILLTDGVAPPQGIRELVATMNAEGMTVSAVALGSGIDEALLKMIAEVGGGRFYKVADPNQLPRIFTRETELISRQAAVEEYFQPRVVGPADFLRGVDMARAPYLHGYVATRMKPSPAQEVLQSELSEPLLARWRIGLGWSIAWTSDVKNLWAVEWLRWPGYGQFWGQLVREHMRQKKRQVFDMRAEVDTATGRAKAVIDAIGGDDRFQNGLDAKLTVTGPDRTKPVTLAMRQTAPGRYESDFPLEKFGAYTLRAAIERTADNNKKVAVAESYGHVNYAYPREYLAFAPDIATLTAAAGAAGGSVNAAIDVVFSAAGESVRTHEDLWPRFVWAAIGCFFLDLLLRRIRIFDRKRTVKRAPLERSRPARSRGSL